MRLNILSFGFKFGIPPEADLVLAAFKPFADHEISEEYRKYSGHEVKKFRAVPEITHRRWKELGLMKPLEPDQTAQYKFSDLQMSLYYTIYI